MAFSSLVLNEVVGSTTGADVEFIELAGPAGLSLDGLSLIVVESDDQASNGAIDFRLDFGPGDAVGANGFFLIGNSTVMPSFGVTPDVIIAANAIENSSYTIALVETASIAGTFVTGGEAVIDALGVTDGETTESFFFGAPVIGPDGLFLPAGGNRIVDGVDTDTAADWEFADFLISGNSPTAATDGPPSLDSVVINEVLGSTIGADVEYVELFGTPGASLDGLSLIIVEGDAGSPIGTIDRRIDFTADDVFGDNGFFLAGNTLVTSTYGVTPDLEFAANFIENSSYTIALVETASLSGGTVAGSEVAVDAIGVTDGGTGDTFFFDAPVFGPDGPFLPAGLRRIEDGVDTDTAGDFALADFNLGPENTPTAGGAGVVVPDPTPLTIMEIQGSGLASAFVGEFVETSGVVTAVVRNAAGTITGAYVQDATGDGDAATSDAIFVNGAGVSGLAAGDAITFNGTVREFEAQGGPDDLDLDITGMTITQIVSQTSGQAIPAATLVDTSGLVGPDATLADARDYFETLEGMLVTATDLTTVAGTNQFGEIFAVSGDNASGLNDLGGLTLTADDYNPEKIQIQGLDFDVPQVDTGAFLGDVTGVISYAFGNYELLAIDDFSDQVVPSSVVPEVTQLQGSATAITVASFNVLNLDPNDADGDTDIADGRFAAIAEQIVLNLGSPDVIGLQEIQDNSGSINDGITDASETLGLLVAAIEAAGGPSYQIVTNDFITDGASGGQPGGNIQTAFLYNADRVDLVPGSVQTIGGQGPGEAFAGARLPLVAGFSFEGEEITVVNNHFSSKGGSAPIVSLLDDFEGSQDDPNVNGSDDERLRQAEAVQQFVAELLAADPAAQVTVLGDFNEFDFNPPLDLLEAAGLTNLTDLLDPEDRFTFNFQGNAQALDHILASEGLLEGVLYDIVNTNSIVAAGPGVASDHDPILALFDLLQTETVSVSLQDRFIGSRAFITDGDGSQDIDFVRPFLRRGIDFDEIGVSLDAEGGRLTAFDGGFGVARFFKERFRDFDEVNDHEALVLSLDGAVGASAVLDFASASGSVAVSAFRDGAAVDLGADSFAFTDGTLTIDSAGLFDELVIGHSGEDFILTGFAIDQVVDDAPEPLDGLIAWSAYETIDVL
jgi:predicted extracellular nuclease